MRKTYKAVCLVALLALATWAAAQNVQITQGPRFEQVGDTWAQIAWSTNVPASTVLRFGTDTNNLNQMAEAPWGGLTHRVKIKNLQPNTTYYVKVESGQAQGTGTQALSNVVPFKTQPAGVQPLSEKGNNAGQLEAKCTNQTANSFDVVWHTDRPGSSVVKFGTDPNNLTQKAQAPWGESDHKVTIKNLQPGKTYLFQVQTSAEKGTGTTEISTVCSCTTKSQ